MSKIYKHLYASLGLFEIICSTVAFCNAHIDRAIWLGLAAIFLMLTSIAAFLQEILEKMSEKAT